MRSCQNGFPPNRYDANDTTCEAGSLPSGHVTNYAQNENGQVGGCAEWGGIEMHQHGIT